MIIVVDSGSTKTRINAIDGDEVTESFLQGINPFYQTEDEIIESLLTLHLDGDSVTHVYHYGAGCSFEEKKRIVRNAWSYVCRKSEVRVESDMEGAAKALFGDTSGIACILGTGANSCFYDGEKVLENVPPLGFILGDEGSGAYIGAKLVANCMKNLYDKQFVEEFFTFFKCDAASIMDGVYKKQFPNRYMATFVPFISANIDRPEMQQLVNDAFHAFFQRNVLLYKHETKNLGFVGGVAKQFEKQLCDVAAAYGFSGVNVVSDPIRNLVSYHKMKI